MFCYYSKCKFNDTLKGKMLSMLEAVTVKTTEDADMMDFSIRSESWLRYIVALSNSFTIIVDIYGFWMIWIV